MSPRAKARLPAVVLATLLGSMSLAAHADAPDPHSLTFWGTGAGNAPAPAKVELPDPTRFAVAVEAGDMRSVRAWLDAGLDPEFMGDRIGTGLMIAAWEGNIPMMELFLGRGADINRTNRVQEQALLLAAWKGRLEAVRWLLDRGAIINRDGLQWSALHYAAFGGHEGVARLLIERGADIDARSTNGASPLMMAAREGHEQVAKMLVEQGADTRIRSDRGDDATVMAMRYDHVRIAKTVSEPQRFAEVARQPAGSFGPPTRSVPVSEKVQTLEREMRFAETMGNLTPESRRAYLEAIANLQREEQAAAQRQEPPKALEISAKRGEPGQESAVLIYDGGSSESPVITEPPKAEPREKPAPKRRTKKAPGAAN